MTASITILIYTFIRYKVRYQIVHVNIQTDRQTDRQTKYTETKITYRQIDKNYNI